jgi:hypothetical protein
LSSFEHNQRYKEEIQRYETRKLPCLTKHITQQILLERYLKGCVSIRREENSRGQSAKRANKQLNIKHTEQNTTWYQHGGKGVHRGGLSWETAKIPIMEDKRYINLDKLKEKDKYNES